MKRAFFLPCLFAAIWTAGPTSARSDWPAGMHPEAAAARLVEAAMPDSRYRWALEWSPFGTRMGLSGVRWHLHPPRPYVRVPLSPGVHQRGGWANVNGRTFGISACGDEDEVARLGLEIAGFWLGRANVVDELTALGVVVTPLESHPARLRDDPHTGLPLHSSYLDLLNQYPALQTWRLEQVGHEPVGLEAAWTCSGPNTRSATQCDMTWSVVFNPDLRIPDGDVCLPATRPPEGQS